jgi:hypothetical protein
MRAFCLSTADIEIVLEPTQVGLGSLNAMPVVAGMPRRQDTATGSNPKGKASTGKDIAETIITMMMSLRGISGVRHIRPMDILTEGSVCEHLGCLAAGR